MTAKAEEQVAEAQAEVQQAEAEVEEAKEEVAKAEEEVVAAVSEATEAKIEAATAEAVVAEVEHMEEITHAHDTPIAEVDTEDDDGESAYEFLDDQAKKAEDENMDIKVQGIISVTPVPTWQLGQVSNPAEEVLAQAEDSAPGFLS